MYPAYYFPNLSDQEMEDSRYHYEHCIDVLRQSVMCHVTWRHHATDDAMGQNAEDTAGKFF